MGSADPDTIADGETRTGGERSRGGGLRRVLRALRLLRFQGILPVAIIMALGVWFLDHGPLDVNPGPLFIYQWISLQVLGGMVLIGANNLLLLARRRRRNYPLPDPPPRVSILVPARDEAANIAACLESLVAQDYPAGAWEVLALDDRSSDGTGAIVAGLAARHPWLRALRGADLPAGWGGKAHACQQLADAATGDWLLFVDADTRHAPGMLRAALGAALAHDARALTALPRERTESFGERLLVPHLFFFLLALQPVQILEGGRFEGFIFANGQFLLLRRDLYDRIGGHAAVRNDLMEDLALGRRCKRLGERILLLDGGDWTACRMYDGFRAAWRGFLRSLMAGTRLAWPYLLGVGSMTSLFFVGPFLVLLGLLLTGAAGAPLWAAAAQVALIMAIRAAIGRGLRQSPLDVALFPPGAAILSWATVVTAWRWLRGRPIEWRGRTYEGLRRGRAAGDGG